MSSMLYVVLTYVRTTTVLQYTVHSSISTSQLSTLNTNTCKDVLHNSNIPTLPTSGIPITVHRGDIYILLVFLLLSSVIFCHLPSSLV